MTPFKAVDGHITENGAKHLANPDAVAIVGQEASTNLHLPCTIIPGHWADRIESGELLTVEELSECYAEHLCEYEAFANNGRIGEEPSYEHLLMKTIARKLRGEAQPKMKGNDNA